MATTMIRIRHVPYNYIYHGSFSCIRFSHSKLPSKRKMLYQREEVKKVRSFILTRYLEYIKNYEKIIETKFPKAMHLYRTFKVGMKEFYIDIKTYVQIVRKLNFTSGGLKTLTLQEIEIYHKLPKNMIKIAPVLLLSALPLTNYVIFPLAYLYPRQLLCTHFWTLQQRSDFQVYYLRKRLTYQRPTFRCMQSRLDTLTDKDMKRKWNHILGLIGAGLQAKPESIIECKELFAGLPYHIKCLKRTHVRNLLHFHGINAIFFKRTALEDHARIILAMDRAILREGGVKNLNQESLKYACFLRGLNPTNMKPSTIVTWLENWLTISCCIDHDSLSLLLHTPILLGYNQPSNWQLIY